MSRDTEINPKPNQKSKDVGAKHPGVFVTIEGVEGSGKSTLRARLLAEAEKLWSPVMVTREPGATEIGRTIRSMLLDPNLKRPCPKTELFLFCADRAEHVEEVIRPSLMRGELVICDRYIHSTLAYQGFGRGMELDGLLSLISLSTDNLQPDLVLLLDIDPENGLNRVNKRVESAGLASHTVTEVLDRNAIGHQGDRAITRFEQEDLSFHKSVREGFLALSKLEPKRFAVINAARTADEVFKEAFAALEKFIVKHKQAAL